MEQREILDMGPAQAVPATAVDLREVFERSYRRLVVHLYGVVGNRGEAEDLVQDAFVRAAAAGRRFERVDNPEAWLRTTAVNLHRNRLRKLRNFGRVRRDLAPSELPGLETHAEVAEALRRLPDGQRQVVVLHYFADLPVSEVAATLHVAEGTVKSRLKRARDAMAGTLGEEAGR
jgi:RNA polymerase sigma-70 factor (ECF subfamily)